MKSSTQTLIKALEILALEIESDGVANAAIAEAAGRLAELDQQNAKLVAQAELLLCSAINVCNHIEDNCMNTNGLFSNIEKLQDAANKTPAQCLREIQTEAVKEVFELGFTQEQYHSFKTSRLYLEISAEAGRAGFMEASRYDFERLSDDKIIKIANDYAAKVREGGK